MIKLGKLTPQRGALMVILGIDPGYAIVGWGVIRGESGRFTPLNFGSVETPAGTPFSERLTLIYGEVSRLLAQYRPAVMAVEKLYFQNNRTTAIAVAEARGVVLLAAAQAGVPVAEYTPMQIKNAVTGYGKAKKPQVMEMTRRLLRLAAVPKPDDTADALAVAICHGQMGGADIFSRATRGTDA